MERCIYAMVNEGARILEDGYALRAGDIDIVFLNGYGFPAYRGGPMWYADTVGLPRVYARISEFQATGRDVGTRSLVETPGRTSEGLRGLHERRECRSVSGVG